MQVSERQFSASDLLQTFRRRRKLSLTVVALTFLLAIVYTLISPRRYEASGVIQYQKGGSSGLNVSGLMGGESGGSDMMSTNVDLQTQARILQSDALAISVIRDLDLEHDPDFKPHFSLRGWVLGLLSTEHKHADAPGVPLEDSVYRRQQVLAVFEKNLGLQVLSGTRLIEVQYTSSSPTVAANVVNHLIAALNDYSFQAKFKATNQASEWLEGQLGSLRKQSQDMQTRVAEMQKSTGLYGVSGGDAGGKSIIYSPALDRLQQTTVALTQAQSNLVLKGAIYQTVKTGDPELISQLSGTTLGTGGGTGVSATLSLIQSLRTEEATMQQQIAKDSATFGSAYPRLIEERASLKRTQQSLADEIHRVLVRAQNDYEIALKAEQGAQAAYDISRGEAEQLNDKAIEYSIVKKEADQSQELYQDLLRRLKEAGILESLHSSNFTVVDAAHTPASPSKPNVQLDLILGLLYGVFLGCGAAFIMEAIDNKIHDVEDVESAELPVFSVLPMIDASEPGKFISRPKVADDASTVPDVIEAPQSSFSEAIRQLRSSLLISRSTAPPSVILVTSGSPGEGKSVLALNLAASFAQMGKRVLLVETDMRRPVLNQRLGLSGSSGLSRLLTDEQQEPAYEVLPSLNELSILPAGMPPPPFPAELLGSQRMQDLLLRWQQEFDFVVLDTPPVLPVADVQMLAGLVDAIVLVARCGQTSRISLSRTRKLLSPHIDVLPKKIFGVAINGVSRGSSGYYGYYGYYGTKNQHYYQEGSVNAKR